MTKGKCKLKRIVRKYRVYFSIIAVLLCCSAFVDEMFGYIPYGSGGSFKGQGEWGTWCVFACENAVFGEYPMCVYATRYVRFKTGLNSLSCCVDGADPEYGPVVPSECVCGVPLKELNFVLNQSSNKGTIFYQGMIRQLELTDELRVISFPCFGIFTNRLHHCVVICGVHFETSVYGEMWTVYYWNPTGEGFYDYEVFRSNDLRSNDLYIWSANS